MGLSDNEVSCRFLSCHKHATLAEDVANGGVCARVGAGGVWELSALSVQFCRESKTVLKCKIYEKTKESHPGARVLEDSLP